MPSNESTRDLFSEPPRARAHDPDTSHAAARAVESHAQRLQLAILDMLAIRHDGLTVVEVAEIGDVRVNSFSPRMVPMEAAGLIRRTDERRQAHVPHTRPGIVWKITEHGRAVLMDHHASR